MDTKVYYKKFFIAKESFISSNTFADIINNLNNIYFKIYYL